jgi:hypothetical protein
VSSEGAPGDPDALRAEEDPRPLSGNRGVTFSDPFGLCGDIKNADGTVTKAPCIFFAVVQGEARGATKETQTAMANVIKNRVAVLDRVEHPEVSESEEYNAVVNQKGQFSSMQEGDPNRGDVLSSL